MLLEALCPECDQTITFATQPTLGQIVICTHCQSALTIIQLNPILLDWAFLEPLQSMMLCPRRPFLKR
jgi:lysine biosynthesis protein LysW